MSEFTKEQLDAAVASAVAEATAKSAELEAQVRALESSQQQGAIEAAVAEATAEATATIEELRTQLDAAVLEASTAKEVHDNFVAELEAIAAERTAAEELEAKLTERVAQVAEVASFPEEYVEANATRWASMTDEAFEQQLEDWRLIASKQTGVPTKTGLHASRETDSNTPAISSVFALMRSESNA